MFPEPVPDPRIADPAAWLYIPAVIVFILGIVVALWHRNRKD